MNKKILTLPEILLTVFVLFISCSDRHTTQADLNSELQQDTQDIFSLLLNPITHEKTDSILTLEIELYCDKLKKYPTNKISFLKRAGQLFIQYQISIDADFLTRTIRDTLFYTTDIYSSQTKSLMDSITKYQGVDEAASERKNLSKVWGDKDSAISLEPDAIKILTQNDNEIHTEMKKIYNEIFMNL